MNQENRKAGKSFFSFSGKFVSWVPGFLISLSVCWLSLPAALGGDAVAIGYNRDGLWTAVTYYSSATQKGERDYKDEAKAREAALEDLHRRGDIETVRWEILSSSDSTAFIAVGRGSNSSNKDENVVGRGKTQAEADANAMAELKRRDATNNQKIVYRYFSHGADGK